MKYEKYSEAIECAIIEILSRRSSEFDKLTISAFILGAGRGPLVDVLINVEKKINLKVNKKFILKKWAVEKNSGAFSTLKFKNENML